MFANPFGEKGNQASKQPGNQATRQPGNQATRQPGNQATRQPGNQASLYQFERKQPGYNEAMKHCISEKKIQWGRDAGGPPVPVMQEATE